MVRLALLAQCAALAGCELIADIPSSTLVVPDDSGVVADGTLGDDGAPQDAPRGCELDAECASDVCLPDGACAEAARIVFASPTGQGALCTQAMPCTFDTAVTQLGTTTDIIKLAPGVYERSSQTEIAASGIIAGTGATFHGIPSTGGMGIPLFYAHMNVTAGKLVVIGLDFDLNSTIGMTCPSGEVQLYRTKMHGGYYGIYGSASCVIGIDRASFTGNDWYGAYFGTGATVTIANSYFTDNNPTAIATVGALVFNDNVTATVTHSTFSNNRGDVASIQCTSSPNVTLTSLISFGNQAPGIAATCTANYSVLDPGYLGPGQNNVTTNPGFIGSGNYHLSPASPVRGLGDPASTQVHDADGEVRPQPAGTRADPGADEVP